MWFPGALVLWFPGSLVRTQIVRDGARQVGRAWRDLAPVGNHTIHCTVYTVHCTVYTLQFTLYSQHCTVYTVQFTLYGIR